MAIVIPTWNRKAHVLRCVASLPQLTYPNFLPVVVDNDSEDGTVAALRATFPDLILLESEVNRGYAGGNNLGIRWALAHGAEYVLLINNDTEVTPDLVTELVRVAETDARIAVVGARNIQLKDTHRLYGAYGVRTYGVLLTRIVGHGRRDGPGWRVVKDVDFVLGNGSLWRRPALEAVGLLDETFFAYHEDADWCVRARRCGYRVVYAGTAAIVHEGWVSSDEDYPHSLPLTYFLGRNTIVFLRKHGRWYQRIIFCVRCSMALLLFALPALVLQLAVMAGARGFGGRIRSSVRTFLRGVIDGLRGRPIPFSEMGLTRVAPVSAPGAPGVSEGVETE